jgi:DNA-binding NtrC family response regulator
MNSKSAPDRILIVCDDANSQTLLEVIGNGGNQVVLTSSGAEALRRLERERFDLVILDVDMPGMHSGEFYAKARIFRPMMRRMALKGSEAVEAVTLDAPQRAYVCLAKPAPHEGIKWAIKNPLDLHPPARAMAQLRGHGERRGDFAHIIGESAPMRHLSWNRESLLSIGKDPAAGVAAAPDGGSIHRPAAQAFA